MENYSIYFLFFNSIIPGRRADVPSMVQQVLLWKHRYSMGPRDSRSPIVLTVLPCSSNIKFRLLKFGTATESFQSIGRCQTNAMRYNHQLI